MSRHILFIWNIALTDGNIGSYRPSVYAAKSIDCQIDIAMNFTDTPNEKRKEIYDGFVLEQNQKIEDYKSELINKNQENAKQQDQEFKNVLNKHTTFFADVL